MIRPKYFIILTDLLLACLCLVGAHVVRFRGTDGLGLLLDGGFFRVLCYLFAILLCAYSFELYQTQKFVSRQFILFRSAAAALTAFFLLSALFYLFPSLQFGRGLLFLTFFIFTGLQICSRFAIRRFSRASQFATRILIVGTGELAQKIADIIPEDRNIHSYVRFVGCCKGAIAVNADFIVGEIAQLDDLLRDYRPQKLILALTERRGALPLKKIMHSKMRGVEVFDATSFYEQKMGCLMIENMQPSEFIYTQRFRMTPFMRAYKRVFDVVLSCAGLAVTLPLMPLLALIIKLDSPGSVFYKQLRVGEREVEYFVYKFRTMTQNAENETGAVWAQKNDSRVTRVGQFMRKSRLDEIPQLFNVLKGDMSFIGPRPERMAFVERLEKAIPYYSTRHLVKPGVTGWAQVRYPYGASDEDALEKLRYDLFYIKNYSIFLDFRIILDTVKVVTSGFGGR